jgi:Tfp pilus assembly protein PilF
MGYDVRQRRPGLPGRTLFEDVVSVIRFLPFRFRLLPFLAAVMVSFTLPALGARLMCRLEVPPGYPLPDSAQVDLKMMSGSLVNSAVAQGNGSITFDRVGEGSYTVTVRAEGYQPASQDIQVPSGYVGTSVLSVTVRLVPEPQPEGRTPSEKTVHVESLKVPRQAIEEIQLAEKAAAKGSLDEAIQHSEKAVEIYPAYFEAYNNLAVYQYQAGRPERAVDYFERALILNPDAAGTNANLGRVLLDLNQPQKAISYLERAAKLNPTSSEIQYHLARAYILSSVLEQSIKPLQLALQLQPPVEHARFLLAHVYYQLGDISSAITELDLYLKTKPKNASELQRTLRAWKGEAKVRKRSN